LGADGVPHFRVAADDPGQRRIGSLLQLAAEAHMPLSTFSASTKVTEPLLPINPVVLARFLLHKRGAPSNMPNEVKEQLQSVAGGAR